MILQRVGKLSFSIFFLFAIFVLIIFIDLKIVKAYNSDVIINEVMVDPAPANADLCKSDSCEWVELYNRGTTYINLKNWTIDNKKIVTDTIILSDDYLIITKNISEFNKVWQVSPEKIIQLAIGLTNSGDSIEIRDALEVYTESFSWQDPPGPNMSWEKIDPKIENDENWHETLFFGGTPGAKNSVTGLFPPSSPTLLSPLDAQEFNENNIDFRWASSEPNLTFEFILSQNYDLSDPIISQPKIQEKNFEVDDLNYGKFYWAVVASNGLNETSSNINSFIIIEPKYCDAIIINELLANPSGEQAGEWIELYNDSTDNVNLKGWVLSDSMGSTHQFTIPDDLTIGPKSYIVIFRSQSDITLNDDGDSVILYQPNGKLLFQTPTFTSAQDDISWARAPDNSWGFTTTPTPAYENKITEPGSTNDSSDDEDLTLENQDDTQAPIEIATGDFENYEGRLVTVTGTVIDTSGDTFYLDDGTGEVKIYIQAITGIDKPTMHKGDIFQIIGIVDLFGGTNWRILPRKQSDIKLITPATKINLASSAKTSAKKASVNAASNNKPLATTKVSKATSGAVALNNKTTTNSRNSSWIQFVLVLTILAAFALGYLALIYRRFVRRSVENTIGGHFGDDET
jgi:hypothetical protein